MDCAKEVVVSASDRWVSFDCFGTLVDWQAWFTEVLGPLGSPAVGAVVRAYHAQERLVERELPLRSYKDVLATALVRATAVCARGSVRLLDRRNVIWSAGEGETEETLNEDRSSVDALLDLFARRVVGGLVPVADVGDVCRAMSMWEELRGAAM